MVNKPRSVAAKIAFDAHAGVIAPLAASIGENSDVTFAMDFAELDHLSFERRRILLGVAQHVLLGCGRVHAVGFYGKVVIVTHDEGHAVSKSP
jgi:hypothetical protein